MSEIMVECPTCDEKLKPGVAVCRACGAILDREKAAQFGFAEKVPTKPSGAGKTSTEALAERIVNRLSEQAHDPVDVNFNLDVSVRILCEELAAHDARVRAAAWLAAKNRLLVHTLASCNPYTGYWISRCYCSWNSGHIEGGESEAIEAWIEHALAPPADVERTLVVEPIHPRVPFDDHQHNPGEHCQGCADLFALEHDERIRLEEAKWWEQHYGAHVNPHDRKFCQDTGCKRMADLEARLAKMDEGDDADA